MAEATKERKERAQKNTDSKTDGVKYEIRDSVTAEDAKTYEKVVLVNTDIFSGYKPRNWKIPLKQFVMNHLIGKQMTIFDVEGNSKIIEFAKTNDRELKNNQNTVINKLTTKNDRNSQIAVANAIELVEVSFYDNENKNHSHQWLDENGWEFRKAYMMLPNNNIYEVTLNIAKSKDGRNILYDINKIHQVGRGTNVAKKLVAYNSQNGDEKIISQPKRNVNEKFDARENKENVATAKAYFGTTYNIKEAGYLLTDGKLLDFSGKHEGGRGGYRTVDHRDIGDAFDEDYRGESYTDAMINFMNEGNIRLSPESGGINLIHKPNKAQMDVLSRYISNYRGEVMLDIDDERGNAISSTEYPKFIHSSVVLNDIIDYFDKGKEITKFDERGDIDFTTEDITDYIDNLTNDDIIFLDKKRYRRLCNAISNIHPNDITSNATPHLNCVYLSDAFYVYAVQSDGRIVVVKESVLKNKYKESDENVDRFREDVDAYLDEKGLRQKYEGLFNDGIGNDNSTRKSSKLDFEQSQSKYGRNFSKDFSDNDYDKVKFDERNNIYDLLGENKRLKQENERLVGRFTNRPKNLIKT